MRWLLFSCILAVATFAASPARADDVPPATENVAQEFSGAGTTTTGFFKVQDRWEVRWNARQVVSVAVMSKDGAIVAGAAGVLRGSLFVPLGGDYYLKVTDGTVPPPAPAPPTVVAPPTPAPSDATPLPAITNAPPTPDTNAAPTVSPFGSTTPPPSDTNAAPVAPPTPPASADTNAAPITPPADADTAPQAASWHLQVVQLDTAVTADQALTVYTPYFMMPDAAVTPVAAPIQEPPPVLTDDQSHTIVTVTGDNAHGTGFFLRTPDGTFVVTHAQFLAANPNLKLTTTTGAPITTTALKGAPDRDLVMFTVQDDHYTYLPAITDDDSLHAGDQLIIPNVGAKSDILLGRPARVMGTSEGRIEFGIRLGPGNSGTPIIQVKTGAAVGIVSSQKKVDLSDRLAKAWPNNPAPGAANIIPYYGSRLTTTQKWETYDPARFLQETLFLKQFHTNTRCLDSFINAKRNPDNDKPIDNKLFNSNPVLRSALKSYQQLANGADQNQRMQAGRELLFDFQAFTNTDLAALQSMKNLYTYNQAWAQEEIAYRIELKKELDEFSDNLPRFDNLLRTH